MFVLVAPSVEIRLNTSSTKWILFLEGGGWCYGATAKDTIKSCAGKAGFVPNNAESVAQRTRSSDYGGVMGSSPETNPDFYDWNAIFIHYCDGASMGSSRTDPIAVKDQKGKPAQLWMRVSTLSVLFTLLYFTLLEREGTISTL